MCDSCCRRCANKASPAATRGWRRSSTGSPYGTDRARPLVRREQLALDHGDDLPRRRVPHPDRPRTRKFHDRQTNGPVSIRATDAATSNFLDIVCLRSAVSGAPEGAVHNEIASNWGLARMRTEPPGRSPCARSMDGRVSPKSRLNKQRSPPDPITLTVPETPSRQFRHTWRRHPVADLLLLRRPFDAR